MMTSGLIVFRPTPTENCIMLRSKIVVKKNSIVLVFLEPTDCLSGFLGDVKGMTFTKELLEPFNPIVRVLNDQNSHFLVTSSNPYRSDSSGISHAFRPCRAMKCLGIFHAL